MRFFLSILLLIDLSFNVKAQVLFNNVYDDNLKFNGAQCLFEYKSNYYSGGASNYCPGCLIESYVLKMNQNGDLENQLNFRVGTGRTNIISSVIEKNNKLYLLGNYIDTLENPNQGYNSFLFVTNESFDSLFLDTINLGYHDRAIDISPYKVGFLLLGYIYNNVGLDSTLISLCYIDSFANIIDTKYFGSSGYDLAYDFKRTQDGGFILGGETDNYPTNSLGQLFLLKLDSNLNQEWYYEYGDLNTDEKVRTFNYLEICNDEGILFGSESYSFNPGFKSVGKLMKFSNLGALDWEQTLDYGDDTYLASIRKWENESIIVVGGVDNYINPQFPFNNPRGFIAKFSADGQDEIWKRFFSKWWGNPINQDYVHDMILTNDGGILVNGYQIHDLPSLNDAWLIKFDSCGFTTNNPTVALLVVDSIVGYTVYVSNLSQEYCTGTYYISDVNGITDSSDVYAYSQWTNGSDPTQMQYTFSDTGNYEISLYATGGDSTSIYTVQFSVEDTTSSIINSNFESSLVSIFPNPAQDYVVIQASLDQLNSDAHSLTCAVYAPTGRLTATYQLNPKRYQQRIFVDELANGVYILNFMLDGRSIGNKRLSVVR